MDNTLNNPGIFKGCFRRTPELDKVVNPHEPTTKPVTALAYSQGRYPHDVTIWVYPPAYVMRKQHQHARNNG